MLAPGHHVGSNTFAVGGGGGAVHAAALSEQQSP
jgi:hypothetical protein